MRKVQQRECRFQCWKHGHPVEAVFKASDTFFKQDVFEPLDAARVFGVDTESLTKAGRLKTVLLPLHFARGSVTLETHDDANPMHTLFDAVWEQGFAVDFEHPSRTKQRAPRKGARKKPRRDGRRLTLEPVLSVWFNMPYDVGRLMADSSAFLRALVAGADTYRIIVSDTYEIEVCHMHLGNGSSFEWIVRNLHKATAVRLLGVDLTGYWKTTLAQAASSLGVEEKIDVQAQIDSLAARDGRETSSIYTRAFESLSEEEWALFTLYGAGDARTHLELYHATVALLVSLDARVIRKNGVIPCSAPGAAARIAFAKAFDAHPDIDRWQRYPAWADKLGSLAYYGGRSFCLRPGRYKNMRVLDLKSAYLLQMCLLPDPVTVAMISVWGSDGFDIEYWRGKYGVLIVSGESLDEFYPAFRVHDEKQNGRLRYVFGPFQEIAVTIPELVFGVLRGALRVDRIHYGVRMQGTPETSFLRGALKRFFDVKEDPTNQESLQKAAKLLGTSLYGKLVEVQCRDFGFGERCLIRHFAEVEKVSSSLAVLYAESGGSEETRDGLYWGETPEGQARARTAFDRTMHEHESAFADNASVGAVFAYCQALDFGGAETAKPGVCTLTEYLRSARVYKCGQYFMPLYAAQVTGATSAILGTMAACTLALQGDTDSVHIVLPKGVTSITELPGYHEYFDIVEKSGYVQPRKIDGSYVGGIPGLESLGAWEEEDNSPSLDSVLVRPKVYSHRYAKGSLPKGKTFKQAKHGFAKFHTKAVADAKPSERAEVFTSELHLAMLALQAGRKVAYVTKPSPRKVKEAVRSGKPVGEFTPREITLGNPTDPNTRLTERGFVLWKRYDGEPTFVAGFKVA